MHGCESEVGGPGHPSIFIGGSGTQSGIHSDTYASRFWMAVLKGKKHYRIFNQSDARYLYPTETPEDVTEDGYHSYFEADAFEPDLKKHPEFAKATLWEANVTAGDIIFVPEMWIHQVRNLESTIAISYNFVDEYSAPRFWQWNKFVLMSESENDDSLDAAKSFAAARMMDSYPTRAVTSFPDTHMEESWHDFFKGNEPEFQPGWNATRYYQARKEWWQSEDEAQDSSLAKIDQLVKNYLRKEASDEQLVKDESEEETSEEDDSSDKVDHEAEDGPGEPADDL